MELTSTPETVARIAELISASDPNHRLGAVLAAAFGGENMAEVQSGVEAKISGLKAWTEFVGICNRAVADCERCPPKTRDLALPPFQSLLTAVMESGSDHAVNQFTPRLDLNSLRLASHAVTLALQEEAISLTEVAEIAGRLDDLILQITASDVDQTLKTFLTAELSRVRIAVTVFHLRGAAGVESAANEATGALVRALLGEPSQSDKAKTLLYSAINLVTEATFKAQALSEHLSALPVMASGLRLLG